MKEEEGEQEDFTTDLSLAGEEEEEEELLLLLVQQGGYVYCE
jgi:hypothetical protein